MAINEIGFLSIIRTLETDAAHAEATGVAGDLNDRVAIALATAEMNFPYDAVTLDRLKQVQRRIVLLTKIDETTIRRTFYNMMVEIALSIADLDREDTPRLLTAYTLLAAMQQSSGVKGILLLNRKEATAVNCPATFQPLVRALLSIKDQVNSSNIDSLKRRLSASASAASSAASSAAASSSSSSAGIDTLAYTLGRIVQEILNRDEFKAIIKDVLGFCKESKNGVMVTEEQVRKTFYQIMADHALTSGLISVEAIREQEAYIYLALSQHALIQAMKDSQDLKGAVALLNRKTLTLANCPDKYKPLATCILDLKDAVCKLTDDQLKILKLSAVDDAILDPHLAALKTPELMEIATRLNSVASRISQIDTFKDMIQDVLKFVEPGLQPAASHPDHPHSP